VSDNHSDEPTGPLSRLPGQQPDEPVGRRHPSPYPPPYTPPQQFAQYDPYPPATQPYPVTAGTQNPVQTRAKLPAWAWPAIAVLSLLLGLTGGALAAALIVHGDGGSEAGGVLGVERRTAAPLPADNGSVAAVAAKVLPSTVQIVAEYQGNDNGATGSGFVYDKQGHIITNNHVVAEADKDGGPIEVIDQDGNHSKATVVGRSTVYDIAVLKAEGAKKLTPAAIGSADQMRVGETVVAIGSPLGLSATVTSGIISAVNRPVTTGEGENANSYINAVQTDAAINPGNSGGPLVNLQGEVVGVNSAIASLGSQVASDQGGNIGVGFAIPIEQVRVTTAQILRTGKAQYPVIGANVRATASRDGATVESISPGAPASDAKLEVGDVILKIDGKPVTGSIDLVVAIRSHVPGEKVTLTVKRGGKISQVEVGLDSKTG
jgi:putative serine protease PepD